MNILILLFLIFVPAICHSSTLDIEKYEIQQEKAVIPLIVWAIGSAIMSIAVGVYNFIQTRKMQKKNGAKANQMDGTIADEGASMFDIAGSPHVYGNITHIFGQRTVAIKSKSGKK